MLTGARLVGGSMQLLRCGQPEMKSAGESADLLPEAVASIFARAQLHGSRRIPIVRLAAPVLACLLVQDAPPVAPPPVPQSRRDETGRTERLAAQQQALEQQLAAMQKFGHEEEWIAAARKLALARLQEKKEPRFVEVGEQVIAMPLLHSIMFSNLLTSHPDTEPSDPVKPHPLESIVDFDQQLAAHGIDLLYVALPSKLAIYPETLLPLPDVTGFSGMASFVTRFLLDATAAGVEVESLTAPFAAARAPADPAKDDLLYLQSDPHWTARGTELAAQVVAARIARYPWWKAGPLVTGKTFRVERKEIAYSAGDDMASRGARNETLHGNCLIGDSGYFKTLDEKSPILVIGDSYTRVHQQCSADFCSQLCRFTGHRIDVVFELNGGSKQVRQKLARRDAAQWKGKKLVIWLVPDQLLLPDSRWGKVAIFGDE